VVEGLRERWSGLRRSDAGAMHGDALGGNLTRTERGRQGRRENEGKRGPLWVRGAFTSTSTVWHGCVEATQCRVPEDHQLKFKFKNLNF
jgi:hypothetical protein